MALTERLALLVTLDADQAIRGLNKVGAAADRNLGKTTNRIDRVAQGMQKAGVGMMASAGLVGVALYKAGQSAAGLEQAVGGTEAVFKDSSGTIDKWAKTAAQDMGLSERAFREATTSIGGQLKALGYTQDEAADKSVELTQTAADLAATYGGTTAEAVQALGAAFRGEADPAERFNLRLNQNTVNAKAVALGLAESTSAVDAQAKAQATLALITEQSADASGQFAREQGSAAGAMAIANAEFENAKATLGAEVAPIMADIAGKAAGLASGFSDLNDSSGGMLSTLATYGTIGLAAGGGLLYVTGKALELRDVVKSGLGLTGLKGAMAAAGTAAIGLGTAWALYQSTMEEARSAGEGAVNDIRAQFEGLDPAKLSMQELRDIIGAMDADLAAISEQKAGSNAPWDADFRAELGASIAQGSEFRAELTAQADAASKLAAEMGITEDAALQLMTGNEKVADAAGATGEEFDAEAAAAAGLVQQLSDLNDALKAQFDPLFATSDALVSMREAQDEARRAVEEYGNGSPEAVAANRDMARAALDYESSLIELGAAVKDGSVSLDDAKRTMQRWVQQGYITQQSADETTRAFAGVVYAAGSVPANVRSTVHANTSDAEFKLRTIQILLGQIEATNVRADVTYAGQSYRRAHGGPIYLAGGGGPKGTDTVPAWLTPGEFVMSKAAVDRIGASNLTAMNQGMKMAGHTGSSWGGGGAQITINLHGRASRADGDELVNALVGWYRNNGALPVRVRG